ncbi:MAG: exodeoxyribonuclease V subunit alpha [Salinisphaeraceae bacterium]|nr:exodeoxyribonuclease V subunit alpha [Salinisphaeraceae bacterium]
MNPDLIQRLRQAVSEGRAQPLELAMAEWADRHGGSAIEVLAFAACIRAVAEGHSCLPLADEPLAIPGEAPFCPADEALDSLRRGRLVGTPGETRPLVLENERLYLHRYWQYEQQLAEGLLALLRHEPTVVPPGPLARDGGVFDYSRIPDGAVHWQAVAAAVAMRHRFAVISGGPGTGKTYTVLRLLRVLIESARARNEAAPLIRLAAPTGKAAARMVESIKTGLASMDCDRAVADAVPLDAHTLHRLVGIGMGTTRARYNRDNPLPADVVVVDEASMVDLPMMAKLTDALAPQARLILLGDRYQLSSVESGSVLAELCESTGVNRFSPSQQAALGPLAVSTPPAEPPYPLADHVVTLQISHRFDAGSDVGQLAQAVNEGDEARVLELLADGAKSLQHEAANGDAVYDRLSADMAQHFETLGSSQSPADALAFLGRRALLCALRVGPGGSVDMNRRITDHVTRQAGLAPNTRWYSGRPIMVLRNDYRAGLFNGDTGVCLRHETGQLRAWFHTEQGLRGFMPTALPEHETAYAFTVHKSQGSEFDQVNLLLPERDNALLTRELLYTGLTRARDSLQIIGSEAVLLQALRRRTRRYSGLRGRLLQARINPKS